MQNLQHAHLINKEHVHSVCQQLQQYIKPEQIEIWLGQSMTQQKNETVSDHFSDEQVDMLLEQGHILAKQLNARLAFSEQSLYVNGQKIPNCDVAFSQYLCQNDLIEPNQIQKKHLKLITELLNLDAFYVCEPTK